MTGFEDSPPASPCIGRCQLDDAGVCLGCFRTRGDIGQWLSASDEEKRSIVASARRRGSERSLGRCHAEKGST